MTEPKAASIAVSVIVSVGFIATLALWIMRPVALNNNSTSVLALLVGALATSFGQVANFWTGSSAGSKGEDAMIERLARQ